MSDARDAARYRWLRDQFLIEGKSKGEAWTYHYRLHEAERFGGTVDFPAVGQKSFDAIIDDLMSAEQVYSPTRK